ncbi:MAG: DUF5763 domain-containing protein [Acidobacteriota bacterium]
MKKRFFRSLENLLENKKVVLPFLGLLAASAVLVWTTAFVPGKKETEDEKGFGESNPEEEKTSAEAMVSQGKRAAGAETEAEHRQCKAITKKGTRCQHMADESGYCRQHRALFEQVPVETNPNL